MKVITGRQEIQEHALKLRAAGQRIGLVPTMGWFHEGHLALMTRAKGLADKVIVSLFVNPIQFGPSEDLDSYPHDFNRDCALAEKVGVDVLYAPEKEKMYPEGFSTTVHVDGLTEGLCGADRPGHFDGVTTVVAKLFNLTLPHLAVFGEKDFQQLAVIRRLVDDLDFPIEIIGHPIVREKSGLAMSSRNVNLQADEMEAALSLSHAIRAARKTVSQDGQVSTAAIIEAARETILSHPQCTIDYVSVVNNRSLLPCEQISSDSMLLLAVKINNRVRLLDNSTLSGSE